MFVCGEWSDWGLKAECRFWLEIREGLYIGLNRLMLFEGMFCQFLGFRRMLGLRKRMVWDRMMIRMVKSFFGFGLLYGVYLLLLGVVVIVRYYNVNI